MRVLQIVSKIGDQSAPPNLSHRAQVRKAIDEEIASGKLVAIGGLAQRATAAARVTRKDGVLTVEDPPGGDGWMAAGGYALIDVASKQEAIERARSTLAAMGDGVIELIEVSEIHPQPSAASCGADSTTMRGEGRLIDHTGVGVENVPRSAAFYDAALGPLGVRRVLQLPAEDGADAVGYGVTYPEFWIDRFHPHHIRQHTAFAARSRAEVDAFHAAALRAGGIDNGPPGLRDTMGYPKGYYAAFVLDPDGNNVEAVFRNG